MKTIKMTLAILLASASISYSQIQLVHNEYKKEITTLENLMYYTGTSTLNIYNDDFSLYKEIIMPETADYFCEEVYLFSDKIFNTDANIEFFAKYYTVNGYRVILFNENLDTLYLFEQGVEYVTMFEKNGSYYLHGNSEDADGGVYNIYQITQEQSVPEIQGFVVEPVYPNPTNNTVNIPYNKGEKASIYNTSGQLIEVIQLDQHQKLFKLSVIGYKKGTYLCKIGSQSYKFIVSE